MTHENLEARCAVVLHPRPAILSEAIRARYPTLPLLECGSYQALIETLEERSPQILLSCKIKGDPDPFPADVITKCRSLEWVHVGAAGVDHLGSWDPAALTVTNSSGIHGELMAQYVTAAMIMSTQYYPRYIRQQRARHWERIDCLSLRGRTVVVVGFGSIGQEIGRSAKFFGMRVIGLRRNPGPSDAADEVWGPDRLAQAAGEADYFVLSLPLTRETRGMIDADVIGALKPGAHLINVSRGGIVDETALLQALDGDRVAGAVLDVFETEPLPPDSPFWSHEKVIVTPHSSSDFQGWEGAVAELFCDNMQRFTSGAPLLNVVSPERGY
jgi:phosphoglycerate dehydrogenase-like enzyme